MDTPHVSFVTHTVSDRAWCPRVELTGLTVFFIVLGMSPYSSDSLEARGESLEGGTPLRFRLTVQSSSVTSTGRWDDLSTLSGLGIGIERNGPGRGASITRRTSYSSNVSRASGNRIVCALWPRKRVHPLPNKADSTIRAPTATALYLIRHSMYCSLRSGVASSSPMALVIPSFATCIANIGTSQP